MNRQPLVSVGITAYNRPKGLTRTLECITKQTYKNLEIIVSDNCSPDFKVKEVAQKFQKKDKRIQYFRQSKNIYSDNGVFVLEKSTGNYFMWASDDDFWDKSYIASCINGFKKSKKIILVGTECDLINPKTGKIMLTDKGFSTVNLSPSERFKKYKTTIHAGNYIGAIFYGIYKRKFLKKIMPFRKVIASDHLVLAELCFYGEFFTIPKKLMIKSWGGASKSLSDIARALGLKNKLFIYFPYFIRELFLQKIIFQTKKLSLFKKIKLAYWSFKNYLNQTKLLYFGMKVNKTMKLFWNRLFKMKGF